nr:reverse transcriptase domain-containing protein [Tanacetum cinerariifolium]
MPCAFYSQQLAEYENSQSRDHPIFLNDDEEHSVQNKESLENSSNEITEVKNVVEQPAERGNRNIQSLQNFIVIHKSSISLKNTYQISSIHAVATILSTKEPEYSSSMGYEHSNTTLETESDEIIKFGVEELVQFLSENKVTLEDNRECDMPVCEDSFVFDNHFEIFSDSKIDDDISVYDDDFEDIDKEEVDLEDISQIQDVDLCEKLLSITLLISNIESLNDNPTPDCVLNSSVSVPIFKVSDNSLSDNFRQNLKLFAIIRKRREMERLINLVKNNISDDSSNDPLLEEVDLFLASDNSIPPGIENFANDLEGDVCFLEELLIDDSILSHESSDSNFEDNPNHSSNPTPSTNPNPKGHNRRRLKQRIKKFNLDELSPPIVTMADQRTMAHLLQAPTEGYEDAIVVPAITADNFELKHGLLTLV